MYPEARTTERSTTARSQAVIPILYSTSTVPMADCRFCWAGLSLQQDRQDLIIQESLSCTELGKRLAQATRETETQAEFFAGPICRISRNSTHPPSASWARKAATTTDNAVLKIVCCRRAPDGRPTGRRAPSTTARRAQISLRFRRRNRLGQIPGKRRPRCSTAS